MIKIFGALLIFLACVGLTKNRITKYRRTFNILNSIITGLKEMSDSISFLKKPLPEIIESLAERDNDIFFKKIAEAFLVDENIHIERAWETALADVSVSISSEAKDVLLNLGKTIGKQTAELEEENIDTSINVLTDILKKEDNLCRENTKTIKSLGVLTGLTIVILFM